MLLERGFFVHMEELELIHASSYFFPCLKGLKLCRIDNFPSFVQASACVQA